MKLKSWSWCLAVAFALVGVRAEAAKFSFSDTGFIDIGALIQAQYIAQQVGQHERDP